MEPRAPEHPHVPGPSLWPVGFALGIVALLVGLVVSWWIVVDQHVDVHDYEQVTFYAGANVDPARDVVLSEGPADHLDHATTRQFLSGKLGIDATAKGPAEGAREWPPEIEMTEEVRELVDARWAEYGIASAGTDTRRTINVRR